MADSKSWKESRLVRWLALGQGVYYLLTGIWPLLSITTFQMVTGPKLDLWLVRTVGMLVGVIGGVLVLAGVRRRMSAELALLAAGSAAGLAVIDSVYALAGWIPPVYLADALVEAGLVGLWLFATIRRRSR